MNILEMLETQIYQNKKPTFPRLFTFSYRPLIIHEAGNLHGVQGNVQADGPFMAMCRSNGIVPGKPVSREAGGFVNSTVSSTTCCFHCRLLKTTSLETVLL